MSIIDTLSTRICQSLPVHNWRDFSVIVAVSGGPDSVALLRLIDQVRKNGHQHEAVAADNPVIVAHFNHRLRGTDSDDDQDFVEALSHRLGFHFRFRQSERVDKLSEEGLREDRYRFFVDLAEETGARLIATGHSANDQAETVLFRLLRGSGLSGLRGIRQIRKLSPHTTIIRPLLKTWRWEIEEVLTEFGQDYRVDQSNIANDYTRNYLRNQLLPELQHRFAGDVESSLIRLGQQATETLEFLDSQCQPLFECVVYHSEDHLRLDVGRFKKTPLLLVKHFLRILWKQQNWPEGEMSYQRWNQLARSIMEEESFSLNLPGSISCRREKGEVWFIRARE